MKECHTTWKVLISIEMEERGDSWDNVVDYNYSKKS